MLSGVGPAEHLTSMGIPVVIGLAVYVPYQAYDTFSMYPVLLRPKSRGYIRLRSSNPNDPPIINPRYLTHPDDIHTMVGAMKISIAVAWLPCILRVKGVKGLRVVNASVIARGAF